MRHFNNIKETKASFFKSEINTLVLRKINKKVRMIDVYFTAKFNNLNSLRWWLRK